jgi:hypothetical protein
MKELFKKWLEKLACRHEWTIIAKTSYTDCNRYLLVCSKCGKLKRKLVQTRLESGLNKVQR